MNSTIGLHSKDINVGNLIFCFQIYSCTVWPHVKQGDMGKDAGYDPIDAMIWQNHGETWQLLDKLLRYTMSCSSCMSNIDCGLSSIRVYGCTVVLLQF